MSVASPSPTTIIPLAQLCRGCMVELEPVSWILPEDERLKMLQLFKLCTDIEVEVSGMPQLFCRDCKALLKSLSTFIKTAKIVNNILLRLVRHDPKSALVNNSQPNRSKSNKDITCIIVCDDDDDFPWDSDHHTQLSEPDPTLEYLSLEEILDTPCDSLDSSTQQPAAITDMNCKSDKRIVSKSPQVEVSEKTGINLKDNINQPMGTEQSNGSHFQPNSILFKHLSSEPNSKCRQYQYNKLKPNIKSRTNIKPDQHRKRGEEVIHESENTEHEDKDEHHELDNVKIKQPGKQFTEAPELLKSLKSIKEEYVVVYKHPELNARSRVLTDHAPGTSRHPVTCRCHFCCFKKVPVDGERMFACTHCPKTFNLNYKRLKHIRNVHPIERWPCPHCHRVYKLNDSLKRHILEKHDDKFVPQFACDKCGKRYRYESALKRHQKFHLENHKHFACHLCGHKCSTRGNLNSHLSYAHSDEKPFECNDCGYRGKTKSSLAKHLKLHCKKRTKQMMCDHCGKGFFDKHGLKMHMIRHIEPQIQCPVCPKRFYEKAKCRTHLQTNHKHMPYVLPSIVSRVKNDTFASDPLS